MKTKLVVVGSAWGPGPAALNRCSMLDTMFVFALGFVCNGPELNCNLCLGTSDGLSLPMPCTGKVWLSEK